MDSASQIGAMRTNKLEGLRSSVAAIGGAPIDGVLFEQLLNLPIVSEELTTRPKPEPDSDADPKSSPSDVEDIAREPSSRTSASEEQKNQQSDAQRDENDDPNAAAEHLLAPHGLAVSNQQLVSEVDHEGQGRDVTANAGDAPSGPTASTVTDSEVGQSGGDAAGDRDSTAATNLIDNVTQLNAHAVANNGEPSARQSDSKANDEDTTPQVGLSGSSGTVVEPRAGGLADNSSVNSTDAASSDKPAQVTEDFVPEAVADESSHRDGRSNQREKWWQVDPGAAGVTDLRAQTTAVAEADPAQVSTSLQLEQIVDTAASSNGSASGNELLAAETAVAAPPAAVPAGVPLASGGTTHERSAVDDAAARTNAADTPLTMDAPRSGRRDSEQAGLARGTSEHDARSSVLTRQQQIRLVQRIARSFNRLTSQGGQIRLRLHPPHLGSLAVRVRIEGRELEAKLTTETAAARDAIMESLPILRARLNEQGFDVTQFHVDVASNGADSASGDGGASQQQSLPDREHNARSYSLRFDGTHKHEQIPERESTVRPAHVWYVGQGIDVEA